VWGGRRVLAAGLQLSGEQTVADIGLPYSPHMSRDRCQHRCRRRRQPGDHRPYRPALARERKAVWVLLADLFDAVAEPLERS
jgi:hypothetical protein